MARGELNGGRRGGFLSSLVYGVCGVVGVGILCGSGLAFYGMDIVDRKFDRVVETGTDILRSLPEIKESLPPALSDAFDDRRAPDYQSQLEVSVEPALGSRGGLGFTLDVSNTGDEVVSMIVVRVNYETPEGQLVHAESVYVATPIAIEGEWAGPILPGSTRRRALQVHSRQKVLTPTVEVCDIRVWEPSEPRELASR